MYYETEDYSQNKKRNSSTVLYTRGNKDVVGVINSFIQIKNENQVDKIYAVITRCVSLKVFYISYIKKKLDTIV